MNRVGAGRDEVAGLAKEIAGRPELELEAVWTHCAVADEPGNPFTDEQLDRFDAVGGRARGGRARPADAPRGQHRGRASSTRAAATTWCGPASRVYGISPSPALDGRVDLRPGADAARRGVDGEAGAAPASAISYGLRHEFERDTTVATVPIGYADGVPRRLSSRRWRGARSAAGAGRSSAW